MKKIVSSSTETVYLIYNINKSFKPDLSLSFIHNIKHNIAQGKLRNHLGIYHLYIINNAKIHRQNIIPEG